MKWSHSKSLKSIYVDWLTPEGSTNSVAVNLNFKPYISRDGAVSGAKHFWNKIDHAVYGNRVKRKGMRIPRACVLEGDGVARNHHYHAIVQLPDEWTYEDFEALLDGTWKTMCEAGRYTKIKPVYFAEGWVKYICKEVKADGDCLCLVTSHIAPESRSPMGA